MPQQMSGPGRMNWRATEQHIKARQSGPAAIEKQSYALIVMPAFAKGGAEVVLSSVARELAQRGWHVTVASLGPADVTMPDVSGALVHHCGGSGRAGSEWRLLSLVQGQTFDLVVSSHVRINAALCCLRRFGLLQTRRLVTRESMVAADRASGLRMLLYRLLYRTYGTQDLVVAQTTYMAEALRDTCKKAVHPRIQVLPNPIDVNQIQHASSAALEPVLRQRLLRRQHIVWCGRLIEIKRPLLAVQTLHALRTQFGLDVGLVMIGDGPLQDQVSRLAAELGLRDEVVLTGRLENPYAIMAACPFGLLTSRREGFPNVLLEMIACGVRHVVSTDCAGDLDQIEGIMIAPGSAEGLASTLSEQLNTRSHYRIAAGAGTGERTPERFVDRLLGYSGNSSARGNITENIRCNPDPT